MITIRIEFIFEKDRIELLNTIEKDFEIVEMGNITQSKKANSKKQIQFIGVVKKA